MPRVKLRTADAPPGTAANVRLRREIAFWAIVVVLLALFLFVFSSILLPFVAGMALAYFLDPVADKLERLGLSRFAATIVILFGFLVALTLSLVIVVPILIDQFAGLIANFPGYVARLQALITSYDPAWLEETLGVNADGLRHGLSALLGQGAGFATTVFKSILESGLALINIASLFVVAPVVAFYMLLDWDRMLAKVDSWVPRDNLLTVRRLAREIDRAISGFVRGQGTLCLILGVIYASGLTIVGLNFGLLIGLGAGLISFIPYVGSLTGLVVALGVACVQFWPAWTHIAAVAAVFFIGQFLEGNVLQPKLVGRSVGVHPVWLMFALLAFGMLFGFVGLLVAVPCAAAIAVLLRFALARYLESPVYTGKIKTIEIVEPADKAPPRIP